ncbi:MAG: hypothetical protein ACLTX9_09450 [Oscillospiraceae bacterium]
MKKNLTKLVSILMVLVMMVGLSGCSNEKNAVLGSWKASMNLAEYLNQGIAQEDATAAEYLSVDSFYLHGPDIQRGQHLYHYSGRELRGRGS